MASPPAAAQPIATPIATSIATPIATSIPSPISTITPIFKKINDIYVKASYLERYGGSIVFVVFSILIVICKSPKKQRYYHK